MVGAWYSHSYITAIGQGIANVIQYRMLYFIYNRSDGEEKPAGFAKGCCVSVKRIENEKEKTHTYTQI